MAASDNEIQSAYDNYKINEDPTGAIGIGIMDSVFQRSHRKGMSPDQWLVWIRKGKKDVPNIHLKKRAQKQYNLEELKVINEIAYREFSIDLVWERGVAAIEIKRRCSELRKAGYIHEKRYSNMSTTQLRNYFFYVKQDVGRKFHDLTSKFDS